MACFQLTSRRPSWCTSTKASILRLAWENSQHSATPALIAPKNDVWEKNTNLAMKANEEFASTNHGMECFNQYKIFALIPQTSFRGESSGGFAKCKLFSQVSKLYEKWPQILPNTIALSWGSKPVTGIKRSVTQKQPSLLLLFSRLYSEKSFKKVLLVNKKKS